jgi:hypothetical protein
VLWPMCCGSPLFGTSGGINGSLRVIKEFFSAFVQPLEERNKAERTYRLPKPRQK